MSAAKACPCGHSKSQHNAPEKQCDYSGYACGCTKWGQPQDEQKLAKVRKAMGL